MSDIFKNNIKEWVSVDNELRILTEHVKELRDKRNKVNNNIIRYVETNQLSNSTIQLSDGLLKFYNQKTYAPLTYSFLENTLKDILSIEQTNQIIKYIKEKRETQTNVCIKRNIA